MPISEAAPKRVQLRRIVGCPTCQREKDTFGAPILWDEKPFPTSDFVWQGTVTDTCNYCKSLIRYYTFWMDTQAARAAFRELAGPDEADDT